MEPKTSVGGSLNRALVASAWVLGFVLVVGSVSCDGSSTHSKDGSQSSSTSYATPTTVRISSGVIPRPGAYLTGTISQEKRGNAEIVVSVSPDGTTVDSIEMTWVDWEVSFLGPGGSVQGRGVINGGGVSDIPLEGIPVSDGHFSYSETVFAEIGGMTGVEGWFISPTEAEGTLTWVWCRHSDSLLQATETYAWKAGVDPEKPRPGHWQWVNADGQGEKHVSVGDEITIRLTLGSPEECELVEWVVEGPEGVLRQSMTGVGRIFSEVFAEFEVIGAGEVKIRAIGYAGQGGGKEGAWSVSVSAPER